MSSWDMDKINKCLEKNLDLDILYTEITKERVDFMHSNNLVVNVWTVNDNDKGEYLVECGVDFITTNLIKLLQRNKANVIKKHCKYNIPFIVCYSEEFSDSLGHFQIEWYTPDLKQYTNNTRFN